MATYPGYTLPLTRRQMAKTTSFTTVYSGNGEPLISTEEIVKQWQKYLWGSPQSYQTTCLPLSGYRIWPNQSACVCRSLCKPGVDGPPYFGPFAALVPGTLSFPAKAGLSSDCHRYRLLFLWTEFLGAEKLERFGFPWRSWWGRDMSTTPPQCAV